MTLGICRLFLLRTERGKFGHARYDLVVFVFRQILRPIFTEAGNLLEAFHDNLLLCSQGSGIRLACACGGRRGDMYGYRVYV